MPSITITAPAEEPETDLLVTAPETDLLMEEIPPIDLTPETSARTALMAAMSDLHLGKAGIGEVPTRANRYQEQISQGGERSLRESIRDEYALNRARVLTEEAVNAAKAGDVQGVAAYAPSKSLMAAMAEADSLYALEKTGVDGMQDHALNDPTQLAIEADLPFDMEKDASDFRKKVAIAHSVFSKLDEQLHAMGDLHRYLNEAATLLPFNTWESAIFPSLYTGDIKLRDVIRSPIEVKAERNDRLFDLPLPEFEKAITWIADGASIGYTGGFNPALGKAVIGQILQGMTEDEKNVEALIFAADVASINPISLSKTLNSSRNAFKFTKSIDRAGAVTSATNAFEKAVNRPWSSAPVSAATPTADAASMTLNLEDLVDTGVLLASEKGDTGVGMMGDIQTMSNARKAAYEAIQAEREAAYVAFREMGTDNPTIRLTPEEWQARFEKLVGDGMGKYEGTKITDFRMSEPDTITGLRTFNIILGKPDGIGGFKSEKELRASLKTRGLPEPGSNISPGVSVFVDKETKQWYGILSKVMKETDAVFPNPINEMRAVNEITAMINNPLGILPPSISMGLQLSKGQVARMNAVLNKHIRPAINAVRGGAKKNLSTMLELGRVKEWTDADGVNRLGKWWTPRELDALFEEKVGRLPTSTEIKGYYAYVDGTEFELQLRQIPRYTQLARNNYQDVEIPGLDFKGIGQPLNELAYPERAHIYDATSKVYYPKTMSAVELKKRMDGGSILVRLGANIKMGEDPVGLILGTPGDINLSPLSPQVINRRQGGHVIYAGSYFQKQARFGTYSDGTRWRDSPLVQKNFRSHKKGLKSVEAHENARLAVDAYRKGSAPGSKTLDTKRDADLLAIAEEKINLAGIKGLKEWDELVANGSIVEDQPFRLTGNRENPPEYLPNQDLLDISNAQIETDDVVKLIDNINKAYTGRRGKALLQDGDKEATILNPFDAMDKALNNAVEAGAMSNLILRETENWVKMARAMGALPVNPQTQSMSNAQLFFDELAAPIDATVALTPDGRRLQNLRTILKSKFGAPTRFDLKVQAEMKRYAQYVEGSRAGELLNIKSDDLMDWTKATDLADLSKKIVFSAFFVAHPGQFIRQTTTALGVAAMQGDPRSLGAAWTMRIAMGVPHLEGAIGKHWGSMHGMSPEEFTGMMRDARRSGFLNVKDGRVWLEGNNVSRVHRGLLWAIYEAEIYNRLVAWNTVTKDMLKKGMKHGSYEMLANTLDRSSAYTMDMVEAGRSYLQKGVLGLATQFQTYPLNQLTNVARLPGFEGYSRWGTSEQIRYLLGQIGLWGTGAVGATWVLDAAMEQVKDKSGRFSKQELEWYKTLSHGSIDFVIRGVSGGKIEPNLGSWASMGGSISKIFSDALTERTLPEVALGPGAQFYSGVGKSLLNVMRFIQIVQSPEKLTTDDVKIAIKDLARNFSAYNEYEKAKAIYLTGEVLSRRGQVLGTIEPEGRALSALASLLGLPMDIEKQTWNMVGNVIDSAEHTKAVAKIAVELMNRASRATSAEEKEAYAKQFSVLLKPLSARAYDSVMQAVKRSVNSPELWVGIGESVYEEKGLTPQTQQVLEYREKAAAKVIEESQQVKGVK